MDEVLKKVIPECVLNMNITADRYVIYQKSNDRLSVDYAFPLPNSEKFTYNSYKEENEEELMQKYKEISKDTNLDFILVNLGEKRVYFVSEGHKEELKQDKKHLRF